MKRVLLHFEISLLHIEDALLRLLMLYHICMVYYYKWKVL